MSLFKYILTSFSGSTQVLVLGEDGEPSSPQNWEKLSIQIQRDKELHSLFSTFSETELTFYGKAADLLENAFNNYGLTANVQIEIQYSPYSNGEYYPFITGLVNFTAYSKVQNKVSITIEQMDNETIFKTRYEDEFNLIDDESIGKVDLSASNPLLDEITLRSRPIRTEAEVDYGAFQINASQASAINYLSITKNGYPTGNLNIGTADILTTVPAHEGEYFIEIFVKWKNASLDPLNYIGIRRNNEPVYIFLSEFNGSEGELTFKLPSGQIPAFNQVIGDNFKLYTQWFVGAIQIEELRLKYYSLSTFEDTTVDCIQIGEAFRRATERVLDGEVGFKSDKFLSSFYQGLENVTPNFTSSNKYVLLNGFLMRGYPYAKSLNPTNEDAKPLTSSFKNLFESVDRIFPLGAGFDSDGSFRVDDRAYFYNKDQRLDLGEVASLEIKPNLEYIYSNLKFGYKKFEKDEEWDNALLGIHGKHEYTTGITRYEKNFAAISEFIADANSIELTRRRAYEQGANKGWKYDKDFFIIEADVFSIKQYADGSHDTRLWQNRQDEYVLSSEDLLSPETMYNLSLTPKRNARRFTPWVAGGLRPYFDSNTPRMISGEPNIRPTFQLSTNADVETENSTIRESDNLRIFEFAQYFTDQVYSVEKIITIEDFLLIQQSGNGIFDFQYEDKEYSGFVSSIKYIANESKIRIDLLATNF